MGSIDEINKNAKQSRDTAPVSKIRCEKKLPINPPSMSKYGKLVAYFCEISCNQNQTNFL